MQTEKYFEMTHPCGVFTCSYISSVSHTQHVRQDKTGNMINLIKPSSGLYREHSKRY